MLALGCPKPTPTPTPPAPIADALPVDAPSPISDLFTGRIFDCHGIAVAKERAAAVVPVQACLQTPPGVCLVGLVGMFDAATVACVTRDLGATANADVLAGEVSALPIANNVRAWILAEHLGYE